MLLRSAIPILMLAPVVGCDEAPDRRQRPDPGPPDPIAFTVSGTLLPDPGSSTTPSNAVLSQGGVQTCTSPVSWSDGPFERIPFDNGPSSGAYLWGGGIGAGDLDGDGLDDVVLVHENGARLFRGTPGSLAFEPGVFGAFDLDMGTGATLVDYDGDDDLDVFITRFDAPNRMLRNEGGLVFTDVTEALGIHGCADLVAGPCYASQSSAWADIDRDGDLDLVVGNYGPVRFDGTPAGAFGPGHPSQLFLNEDGLAFTDHTADLLDFPEVHEGYTFVAGFTDFDADGWPDLLFVNDFGPVYQPNRLLWNQGGSFVLDLGAAGLDQPMTGMCLASSGDLNGDLLPDVFVTEFGSIAFLVSNAALGLWVRYQSADVGMTYPAPDSFGWGCEYADLDLDGALDVITAAGHLDGEHPNWSNPPAQPDALFMARGDLLFSDEAPLVGMDDPAIARGFAVGEFNGDGHLDVVKRNLDGGDLAYLSHCTDRAWLRVELRDPTGLNTRAIGAVVDVWTDGIQQRRWTLAGGQNFASGQPATVHFGLGQAERIDAIAVTWPDGQTSRFTDLPTRQTLTITRLAP